MFMSQEEEKLIEDFEKEYCFSPIRVELDDEAVKDAHEFILKAYRAGKLAGFEMCEKMADEMTTGLDMLNQIDAGKVFAIGTFKSLIEEEKKL